MSNAHTVQRQADHSSRGFFSVLLERVMNFLDYRNRQISPDFSDILVPSGSTAPSTTASGLALGEKRTLEGGGPSSEKPRFLRSGRVVFDVNEALFFLHPALGKRQRFLMRDHFVAA